MKENTTKGRELYYSIQEIINALREEITKYDPDVMVLNLLQADISSEVYLKVVEVLNSNGLVDRSVFIREVTSPNEPTKKGGSQ